MTLENQKTSDLSRYVVKRNKKVDVFCPLLNNHAQICLLCCYSLPFLSPPLPPPPPHIPHTSRFRNTTHDVKFSLAFSLEVSWIIQATNIYQLSSTTCLVFRVLPKFHFICKRKYHGSPFLGCSS